MFQKADHKWFIDIPKWDFFHTKIVDYCNIFHIYFWTFKLNEGYSASYLAKQIFISAKASISFFQKR